MCEQKTFPEPVGRCCGNDTRVFMNEAAALELFQKMEDMLAERNELNICLSDALRHMESENLWMGVRADVWARWEKAVSKARDSNAAELTHSPKPQVSDSVIYHLFCPAPSCQGIFQFPRRAGGICPFCGEILPTITSAGAANKGVNDGRLHNDQR